MKPLVLGALASGSGSNFQAILDAAATGRLDARVGVVVSDNPEAFALERAREAGVPFEAIPWAGIAFVSCLMGIVDAGLSPDSGSPNAP